MEDDIRIAICMDMDNKHQVSHVFNPEVNVFTGSRECAHYGAIVDHAGEYLHNGVCGLTNKDIAPEVCYTCKHITITLV